MINEIPTALLVSPLASMLTTLLAKAPGVPFEGRTKAGILAALLLCSTLLTVATAWLQGTLGSLDVTAIARLLLDAGTMAAFAYTGHTTAKQLARAAKNSK